ncbi:MAG: 3-deoxy-7-phosphoheptulonate synthase class II [Bryobacteraceae bacterium]|nr:3-deoxy-7-phosphoheptulonate synthase class II [Bryobacteraceae bacterium]
MLTTELTGQRTLAWTPDSWRSYPAEQQPEYASASAVDTVVRELSQYPPLVTPWEVEALKRQLADASMGSRFLLQGGDCAESFAECAGEPIVSKIKILLQMSLVLVHGIEKPVIRVGRMAGQYAKPRSEGVETREGVTLPTYRGDIINGSAFHRESRIPDPQRMLRGYEKAALTLNYVRALARGTFADLHHPENWESGFLQGSELSQDYSQILRNVSRSLRFLENVLHVHADAMQSVEFFTSHEGLLLPYEQAQTREQDGRWYNLSTHLPWIGARTLQPGGAHVEYFRGISNPIGIKVSATLQPDTLLQLLDTLDPHREPGRITLIHRFGRELIATRLPDIVQAVRGEGRVVLWCCDPMHGNTRTTTSGVKTRFFTDILSELEQAFEIHDRLGTRLGGVHFEMSGENVTECIGGSSGIQEADLGRAYKSEVDPRLNYEQALEIAMLIAHRLQN